MILWDNSLAAAVSLILQKYSTIVHCESGCIIGRKNTEAADTCPLLGIENNDNHEKQTVDSDPFDWPLNL